MNSICRFKCVCVWIYVCFLLLVSLKAAVCLFNVQKTKIETRKNWSPVIKVLRNYTFAWMRGNILCSNHNITTAVLINTYNHDRSYEVTLEYWAFYAFYHVFAWLYFNWQYHNGPYGHWKCFLCDVFCCHRGNKFLKTNQKATSDIIYCRTPPGTKLSVRLQRITAVTESRDEELEGTS